MDRTERLAALGVRASRTAWHLGVLTDALVEAGHSELADKVLQARLELAYVSGYLGQLSGSRPLAPTQEHLFDGSAEDLPF